MNNDTHRTALKFHRTGVAGFYRADDTTTEVDGIFYAHADRFCETPLPIRYTTDVRVEVYRDGSDWMVCIDGLDDGERNHHSYVTDLAFNTLREAKSWAQRAVARGFKSSPPGWSVRRGPSFLRKLARDA